MSGEDSTRPIRLDISRDELVLIGNTLNEVCNCVDFTDTVFHTRVGGSREEARALLRRVVEALDGDCACPALQRTRPIAAIFAKPTPSSVG